MKKLIQIFLILSFSILSPVILKAQEDAIYPIDINQKSEIVASLANKYAGWDKVSLSGRLTSSMLPVAVTVKIYMENDKLILISLSAPLFGEVGRLEIDRENVLGVNKMGKKYTRYALSDLQAICPGGLRELQSLILGRVSLLGKGSLTKKDASSIEIYDTYPDKWVIVPNSDFQQEGAVYFYTVERQTLDLLQFFVVSDMDNNELGCKYSWQKNGDYTMDLEALVSEKGYSASLKLGAPVRETKPMDRIKIDSKYREVSLKQLLSF